MRSALTAALSGKPESRAPADSVSKADTSSFPCLDSGGFAVDGDALPAFERLKLSDARLLPGSAPTAVLLSDGTPAADYELNPHRRRGGEERVPLVDVLGAKSTADSGSHSNVYSNFVSDAIIGSLPKGLSGKEREKIFQSVPLSPTLNLLHSMPSEKVSSRSLDGKRLRRHVLRGAVIIFVTAGYSGKKFIFEKAKELGVRSVIIDGPDSWSQSLEKEGIVERFIGLDFSDAETVFERCLGAVKKAQAEFGELDGICTFCEMAVPLVARLAEKLGLPGNTPAAVDTARDKHATRAKLKDAGLPTPKNFLISEPRDVKLAADAVGFPAVIKPIYGAASIGVVRVDSYAQLEETYVRVQREMAGAKIVDGALVQGDNQSEGGKASGWIQTTLMLEEYLDGPEVDVDLVFSDGQPVYGCLTDNWPTVEPYFNETGSNCPSILPMDQQRELIDLGVQSTQALGFTQGVFHVELKYTSRGPRLIEVNCRMGGGPVRNINLLVWGVDLVEEHLLTTAGIPSRPPVAPKPLMNIAEFSSNAKATGIVRNDTFCQPWQEHPDVLYCRPLVKKGDKVTAVTDGLPTWVAEMMVTKPTVQEAIAFVTQIENDLAIEIA